MSGAVGVSTTDPGNAWGEDLGSFTLAWREATVPPEARGAL